MRTFVFGSNYDELVEAMQKHDLKPGFTYTAHEGGWDDLVKTIPPPTKDDQVLFVGDWFTRSDIAELLSGLRGAYLTDITKAQENAAEM